MGDIYLWYDKNNKLMMATTDGNWLNKCLKEEIKKGNIKCLGKTGKEGIKAFNKGMVSYCQLDNCEIIMLEDGHFVR